MGNPNPSRITDEMWRMWTAAKGFIPGVRLGGIFAAKPGYHNRRSALPSWDYSVQYAADRDGPADAAAAIDLTFPEAHNKNYHRIQLVTKRLMEAARDRDPRIYRGSTPVIREVIGNVGGRARAYDLYSRREDGRDDSHLWHIHLSVTRRYVDDWPVLAGLVSIMAGEDDMDLNDRVALSDWITDNWPGMDDSISVRTALGSGYGHARSAKDGIYERVLPALADMKAQVAALTAAVGKLAEGTGADPEAIRAAAEAGARAALADLEITWSTDGE